MLVVLRRRGFQRYLLVERAAEGGLHVVLELRIHHGVHLMCWDKNRERGERKRRERDEREKRKERGDKERKREHIRRKSE